MEALVHCRNHESVFDELRYCTRCGAAFCSDCLVEIGRQLVCGSCKAEQLLDVRSGVSTDLPFASISRRFAAALLDGLPGTAAAIWLMVWQARSHIRLPMFNVYNSSIRVAFIVYEALMFQWRGQTLGKMALKVRVIQANGDAYISGGRAWGRALLKGVLGWGFLIDYLPAFFTTERTTIHDLLAKTRVVSVE